MSMCLLSANSTDHLQQMDISVIKPFKACLQRKFVEWYSEELVKQLGKDEDMETITLETGDLRLVRMKEVGAAWLVETSDHISDNPFFIVHGFHPFGVIAATDEVMDDMGLKMSRNRKMMMITAVMKTVS